MITHLEPDILECEVKWALGSITTNKASGGDGIPVELFQILEDDSVKVLHLIWQQIWKTQQWPQDWKRSVFRTGCPIIEFKFGTQQYFIHCLLFFSWVINLSWIFISAQWLSQSSSSLHHQTLSPKKCSLFSLLPEATIVKLPPLLHKHWSDLMQMFLQSLLILTSWSPGHFLRFSLLLSRTSGCSSRLSLLSPSLILPHLQCWCSPEVFYRSPFPSTVSLAKHMVTYILMTSHLYI